MNTPRRGKRHSPIYFYLHGDQDRAVEACPIPNVHSGMYPKADSGPLKYLQDLEEEREQWGYLRHKDNATYEHLKSSIIVCPVAPANSYWFRGGNAATDDKCNAECFNKALYSTLTKLRKDVVAEYNDGNADDLFVTGLSMGGYGSFDLAALWGPQVVKAVVPTAPSHETRFHGNESWMAERLAGIPMWVHHGRPDGYCKFEETLSLMERMKIEHEVKEVKLTSSGEYWYNSHGGTGYALETAATYEWLQQL